MGSTDVGRDCRKGAQQKEEGGEGSLLRWRGTSSLRISASTASPLPY